MNNFISNLNIEQRKALISSLTDMVMSMQTREDSINQLIKIIICESIYSKKYDVLQHLAHNQLI